MLFNDCILPKTRFTMTQMSVNDQKIDFQCPQCGSILRYTLMGFLFCEECDKEFTEEEIRESYST